MNKTFKRVLASMLAILMIICSMPFTALAACEPNRKWWVNEGVSLDQITAEPEFIGGNSDETNDNHPYGSNDFNLGDVFVSFEDVWDEDLRDNFKPILAVTVSDIGTKNDLDSIRAKQFDYYTYDGTKSFEATKANILDPNATLKAGQRIAITLETGGFDIMNAINMLGSYDKTVLQPGYYSGVLDEDATTDRVWKKVSAEAVASMCWRTSSVLYDKPGDPFMGYGTYKAFDGEWMAISYNKLFTNGGAEVSQYIGTSQTRDFQSQYGLVLGTITFEVLKDCNVKEAFTIADGRAGSFIGNYHPNWLEDGRSRASLSETDTSYAIMPTIWVNPNGGGSEECTHANTTTKTEVTTAATCETAGVETVTVTCDDCGEVVGEPTTNTIPALGHDYTGAVEAADTTHHTVACVNGCGTTETVDCTFTVVDHQDATFTEEGYDDYKCTACTNNYRTTIPVVTCEHANKTTTKTVEKAATCTETGLEKVVVTCDDCGVVVSEDTNTIEKLAHTEKVVAGTPATCTSTGLTDGKVCEVCDTVLVAQEEIAMIPHTEVEIAAVAATCTEGGKTAGVKCSVCDTVITAPQDTEALGHNYVEVEGSAVAPTVDAAGKKADQQCTRCDDVIVGEAIPALASYEITVAATDLGVVTLNGADVTNGAKVKVEAGSTVTLTAEPIEGAKFLGWTANGLTTVSTDTTFTTVALANVTYAPVFEKADAASFTVVFADAFGNIVSSQVVTDGSQIVIPDAPARSGYVAATENGWTMTNEEIQALTSSATVIAVYELAENEGYTVTANGATITGDGIEATDVATGVAYDTLVTVYKEGAKGWAVNGVTVAYGDTYSFYVGKDIEVVAVMDGVTAVPMVANVGVNEVGQPGRIQAQFIATRTMADGYTYIDSGFVYGKGDLGEITLFDVDGSAVKAAYTKTASEQFSVTYGLSAQTGTITARAFIAYANADGEVTVTYGAPMTYQYK